MAAYTRSGREKPRGGGFELAVWYLMRLTGLGLFVLALAHYSIVHFLFDPSAENASWIAQQRWGNLVWQTIDWLMLVLVIFHSFMGVRTVLQDYTSGAAKTFLTMGLYLLGVLLFLMGTIAVMTLTAPVP